MWGTALRQLRNLFPQHACKEVCRRRTCLDPRSPPPHAACPTTPLPAHPPSPPSQFLRCWPLFDFREDTVPQLEDLSAVLQATTGFRIRPVAGLVRGGWAGEARRLRQPPAAGAAAFNPTLPDAHLLPALSRLLPCCSSTPVTSSMALPSAPSTPPSTCATPPAPTTRRSQTWCTK